MENRQQKSRARDAAGEVDARGNERHRSRGSNRRRRMAIFAIVIMADLMGCERIAVNGRGAPLPVLRARQPRAGAGNIGISRADSGTVARTVTAMIVIAVVTPKPSPINPIKAGMAADAAMAPV